MGKGRLLRRGSFVLRDEHNYAHMRKSRLDRDLPYDVQCVPRVLPGLDGSFLEKITSRHRWFSICGEMTSICQESTRRRLAVPRRPASKTSPTAVPGAYIADRLDTDDPLSGYCVRHRDTGWLQGFVTFTTFTSWTHWFQWDSCAAEARIAALPGAIRDWGLLEERSIDWGGELSAQLEKQKRAGNADAEGIVWPRVAELGCIGSLGCGKFLMQIVINELAEGGNYDFLVLQATNLSVPFYEMLGFVRVGAVARYAKSTNIMDAPVVAYKHWHDTPPRIFTCGGSDYVSVFLMRRQSASSLPPYIALLPSQDLPRHAFETPFAATAIVHDGTEVRCAAPSSAETVDLLAD